MDPRFSRKIWAKWRLALGSAPLSSSLPIPTQFLPFPQICLCTRDLSWYFFIAFRALFDFVHVVWQIFPGQQLVPACVHQGSLTLRSEREFEAMKRVVVYSDHVLWQDMATNCDCLCRRAPVSLSFDKKMFRPFCLRCLDSLPISRLWLWTSHFRWGPSSQSKMNWGQCF